MAIWEPIVTQLLLDGFLNKPVSAKPSKKKAAWWLMALSVFTALAGLVYLFIALHLYLVTLYMPITAALLTGGALLVLAAMGVTGFFILEDARKLKNRAQAALETSHRSEMMEILDKLTSGLEEPIANNPRTSALIAALSGFIAGHRIH